MYIRCVNNDRKQIAHNIGYNMVFAAFRFFPPSMPRSSAAAVVLTLCESINP